MQLIFSRDCERDGTTSQSLRTRNSRGELARVYPGAFLDPAGANITDLSVEQRHVAAIAGVAPSLTSSVFSGVSAAVLHGLPIPRRLLSGRVHVTRESGGPSTKWLRVARAELAAEEIELRYGLPVTSLKRTLRDLHEHLNIDEMLAAGDMAKFLGADLSDIADGSRHAKGMRRLRDFASERSESPAESMSRSIMLRFGLPTPLLQVAIFDEDGTFMGRSDFGWPEFNTLGEFDGETKYNGGTGSGRTGAQEIMAEKERDNGIVGLGWNVSHWGWRATTTPQRIVEIVERALATGARLEPPRGTHVLLPMMPRELPDWSQLLGTPR